MAKVLQDVKSFHLSFPSNPQTWHLNSGKTKKRPSANLIAAVQASINHLAGFKDLRRQQTVTVVLKTNSFLMPSKCLR